VQKTAITDLLEAGVHFGHQTKRWNPKMKPYIFGTRNGITIFDLTKTMRQLAEACAFLRDTASSGGKILFVGSKRQAQEVVREMAEKTGMFSMCDRWLGGTLTNHSVMLTRIGYLTKLRKMEEDGSMAALPKKEAANLRRERGKLERTLGGILGMKRQPQALVVIDVGHDHIAVREAHKLGIPVVALVDSNCSPEMVDYLIPGNDDALRSIKIIVDTLGAAVMEGLNLGGKNEDVDVTVPEEIPAPKAAAKPAKPAKADVADVADVVDDAE
jgi:small subunit ribosomal protein S2